jgi:hypothetical protein
MMKIGHRRTLAPLPSHLPLHLVQLLLSHPAKNKRRQINRYKKLRHHLVSQTTTNLRPHGNVLRCCPLRH